MDKDAYIQQLQTNLITAGSMKTVLLEGVGINNAVQHANANAHAAEIKKKEIEASEKIGSVIGSVIGALAGPLNEARDENAYFKEQLSRPLMDIINENKEYKDAFEKQREILERWMVTQNAFKKLAFEYGKQSGKSEEDIKNEMLIEQDKVIASGVVTTLSGAVGTNLRVLNKK